mmetsp:Transcript_12776/g.33906  ORF Transcript_12776/g.33906 Transcript_12776/m.33906 type:complete len:299 (+) Transcript_12776:7-903(+)
MGRASAEEEEEVWAWSATDTAHTRLARLRGGYACRCAAVAPYMVCMRPKGTRCPNVMAAHMMVDRLVGLKAGRLSSTRAKVSSIQASGGTQPITARDHSAMARACAPSSLRACPLPPLLLLVLLLSPQLLCCWVTFPASSDCTFCCAPTPSRGVDTACSAQHSRGPRLAGSASKGRLPTAPVTSCACRGCMNACCCCCCCASPAPCMLASCPLPCKLLLIPELPAETSNACCCCCCCCGECEADGAPSNWPCHAPIRAACCCCSDSCCASAPCCWYACASCCAACWRCWCRSLSWAKR